MTHGAPAIENVADSTDESFGWRCCGSWNLGEERLRSIRKRSPGDSSRPHGREAPQETERTNHEAAIVLDDDWGKAHR